MDETPTRWFFIDEAGNLRGPATVETLSVLVGGGVVTPSTQMRKEDSEEWTRADQFFDFIEAGNAPRTSLSKNEPVASSTPVQAVAEAEPRWFYSDPEIHKVDPLSFSQVCDLIKQGIIVPDTTMRLWNDSTWRPAEAFFDFSSVIPDVIDKTPKVGRLNYLKTDAEWRGEQGEVEVLVALRRSLPIGGDRGYRIIRNLMFETPTGTTQLDLTVVSAYGVFIIEVKNYSGWIFGDPSQPRWTQSLRGGSKFQFQNPIRQNFKHLAVLSEKTGIPQNLIFPLVAFADECDFKTELPANVMHFGDVAGYIQKFKSVIIKPEQLTEIMEAFLSWDNAIDCDKKREHVQNLKDAHAPMSVNATNVLCPVCNDCMVLRYSRKGGRPFWGCSKYPECKGIREAIG